MRISLNDGFVWRYIQEPYYRAKDWLSDFYYRHKKRVYTCHFCGLKEAPFILKSDNSIREAFGWHHFEDGRWVCHHCSDHYGENSISQKEWERYVKEHNAELKNKVLEYHKTGKRIDYEDY